MPLYKRSKRSGAVYWVRIGRKTRETTGTADREAAEEYERLLKERLWRVRKLGDRSAVSWDEAAKRWLMDSRRERRRDRELLQWLSEREEGPQIGAHPISAVADPDVLEGLRKYGLAAGWSHSTVDRMMRTVRSVLRRCVVWRYLEHAPPVPQYGEDEAEPRFITEDQFQKLCEELPPHLERAARFAVMTLLRKDAQARLTWDRIDLKAKRAWVPRGHMKGGKPFGFQLSPDAIKLLRECRAVDPTGERVFQYEGRPIANFHTAAFQKAGKRAGLERLRWHDLRHTGASWAVQSGVSLQELMAMGDWKSYRMVLRYGHLAPANTANAAHLVGTKVAHAVRKRRKAAA